MLPQVVFAALICNVLASVSVTIDDTDYESFGLTGFGFVASDAVDKYDETISMGSSVQYQDVTIDEDGIYHFTAFGLPDRGMNIYGTVNTIPRVHTFNIDYTPKNSSKTKNIIWNYKDTLLLTDMNGNYMTGLDCNTTMTWNGKILPAVSYQGDGWGKGLNSTKLTTAICIDAESLTLIDGNIDNGFWIGDEYGPGLFKFNGNGKLVDYIQAPDAITPYYGTSIDFSSNSTPNWDSWYKSVENDSGRVSNKGYEGMAISPDGKYLYAMLQSATLQDGGSKSKHRMNTRLVKYDLTGSTPSLVGEYVVVLPTYEVDGKVKTADQSELRVITEDLIMVLPRDSKLGNGGSDGTEAIFKHIDFWSLKDADNIVHLYDGVDGQVATSKGKLKSSITPATHYAFIDMLDADELAKFGLHNGGAVDENLINEKWEGFTLIPKECTTDEYYLLVVSDNDYQTTNGYEDFGTIEYSTGNNVNSQSLMYHVKLPSLKHQESFPLSCSEILASSASSLAPSSAPLSASSLPSFASSSLLFVSSTAFPSSGTGASSLSSSTFSTDILSFVFDSTTSNNVQPSTVKPQSSSQANLSSITTITTILPQKSVQMSTYTTIVEGFTTVVTEPCTTDTKSGAGYSDAYISESFTTTVTSSCSTAFISYGKTSNRNTIYDESTYANSRKVTVNFETKLSSSLSTMSKTTVSEYTGGAGKESRGMVGAAIVGFFLLI